MAFSDPITITISGVAKSLSNTGKGFGTGTYATADPGLKLLIQNTSKSGRTRSIARHENSTIAADPFIPANNRRLSAIFSMTLDRPTEGFSNADLKAMIIGELTFWTASSGAAIDKWLAGEI